MRLEPIWVASLILWLSPPESVPAARESVRYDKPTACKNRSRDRISRKICSAMTAMEPVSSKCSIKSSA